VQPRGAGEISPAHEREWDRSFLGKVPSHGIIEPLRLRAGEAIFGELPPGDYGIILHTTAGVRRRTITATDRATLLRVCN
jgi:hypothetical protein